MITITFTSLSGGQGKSTSSLLTGKRLAKRGHRVLLIDCDSQAEANLTFFLGLEIGEREPTLYEVLVGEVKASDAIYSAGGVSIIPADKGLDGARRYLAESGMGALILRQRLKPLQGMFDYCVIDSPPQRGELSITSIAAADLVIIPAEAASKGAGSLMRTLEVLRQLEEIGGFQGKVLGVLPFRDNWVGRSQTHSCKEAIAAMVAIAGDIPVLPSVKESDRYKRAINEGTTPGESNPELEYPYEEIIRRIEAWQS